MSTVLVVDNDCGFVARLKPAFECAGFVVSAVDTISAARAIADNGVAAAIVDLYVRDGNTVPLIAFLRGLSSYIRIIVAARVGSISTATVSIRSGADEFFCKPVAPSALLARLLAISGELHGDRAQPVMTLEQARWQHIVQTLRLCNNSVSQAARLLGIHRQSLQRMLRKNAPQGID